MSISRQEFEAVLRLDGPARFRHFIKRVADAEEVWGLWDNGWALMADDAGHEVFPLWPAADYAEATKTVAWSHYGPESIGLDELLEELLPSLTTKGVLPAVFPTPNAKGVVITAKELEAALREELRNYDE